MYNISDVIEAVEAINNINSDLYENNDLVDSFIEEYGNLLSLCTDGNCVNINFMGKHIWDSESDERIYLEEHDDYEPIYPFLVKQIKKRLEIIRQIQIK